MHTEIKELLEAQGSAFEEFKTRFGAELKAEREEREALELRLSRNGPVSGPSGDNQITLKAERKAVAAFLRDGDDSELKSMSVGSDPDGGYTVMPQMASQIRNKVREVSPIAELARRVLVGNADGYSEPYEKTDMDAEWSGETASRADQETPKIGLLNIPLHEIFTQQPVTQKLLDTSMFDLGAWIEERIAAKFARSEGAAFISGSGVIQPRGILNLDIATDGDSTRSADALQYIASGGAGAFASGNPADKLVDMIYALRPVFRRNANWLMNSQTAGQVRKLKDGMGRFLWSDGLAAGQPNLLLGYPVAMDEQMPDISADSLSIAFGDFREGYTIVEQPGIKMIRDPFTMKPHVKFFAYRRVGGDVSETDAIKLMKFAAS
ncbi:phage major capsid protein [Roseovarius spongiae]|nr:phage major capsid protein [Roseovarius spongiae]